MKRNFRFRTVSVLLTALMALITLTRAADTFSLVTSLTMARAYYMAMLLPNSKVLVAGGTDGNAYLNSAELYDPTTNTWSTTSNMAILRAYHTATLLSNNKVLVTGGYNSAGYLNRAELYKPTTNTWGVTPLII